MKLFPTAPLRWHGVLLLALAGWGCQPVIGDKCTLSTDCSTRGDRQCDTSQPGGYCTVPNCRGNTCPDKASCVLFRGTVPGCSYDDRSLARTGHSFCSAVCNSNADCRAGYECANPRDPPWRGIILDDTQELRTCLARPSATEAPADGESNVCRAAAPDVAAIEAGAGAIEPRDAGVDAQDAAADAQDGGADAPADAPGGG